MLTVDSLDFGFPGRTIGRGVSFTLEAGDFGPEDRFPSLFRGFWPTVSLRQRNPLGQPLVQPFKTSARVTPILAGERDTLMPAASIAAILPSAPPLPPEITAPA